MSDSRLRSLEREAATGDLGAASRLLVEQCRTKGCPPWDEVYDLLTEETVLDASRVQRSEGPREYRKWLCPRCGNEASAYLLFAIPPCKRCDGTGLVDRGQDWCPRCGGAG